ncbi:hypothetical protein [Alcanivorax quisquiliarum]|uniref:Uncharacterized protein n=1 Tax=Alcanivorax quisquiliarum TaxID=2933565 RepID=A0ABT0E9P7_9GAMM|nr:hypothetical protein [Alcanivorax quisquiliarum]MCK0538519.1 hypothetical protein [Alcanivorax quisquiliarum]
MIEKQVATVPQHIWEDGRPARLRVWEGEYNVASWVRITGATGPLELAIVYTDEAGEHRARVDSAVIRADGSALLSGMVKLRFTGQVGQVLVTLGLGDAKMRFVVEELYVQRRGSVLNRADKLISNY